MIKTILLNIICLSLFAAEAPKEINCTQTYGLNYLKKMHETLLLQDNCPTGPKEIAELNSKQNDSLKGLTTCSKMTKNFERTALPTFNQSIEKQLLDFKTKKPTGKCEKAAFEYEVENYKELAVGILKFQRATDACAYVEKSLNSTDAYAKNLIKKCEPSFDKEKCELGEKSYCLQEDDEKIDSENNKVDEIEKSDEEDNDTPASTTTGSSTGAI